MSYFWYSEWTLMWSLPCISSPESFSGHTIIFPACEDCYNTCFALLRQKVWQTLTSSNWKVPVPWPLLLPLYALKILFSYPHAGNQITWMLLIPRILFHTYTFPVVHFFWYTKDMQRNQPNHIQDCCHIYVAWAVIFIACFSKSQ